MHLIIKTALAVPYISESEMLKVFNNQPKCKISGEILSQKSIVGDDPFGCYGKHYIRLSTNNGKIEISGDNQMGPCVGSDPIFSTYFKKNIPNIGENGYFIINSETLNVLKYGNKDYINFSEIQECSKEFIEKNQVHQNSSFGIIFLITLVLLAGIGYVHFQYNKKKKSPL